MTLIERNFSAVCANELLQVDRILGKSLSKRKPANLYSPAYYIIESGGKRLRPLLVILSAKAVGGKCSDAYYAGAAVELLHNFTLVHDDIMDNADKRRGRLTLHVKYDQSTAILAGDSLVAVAYENLLRNCNGNAKEIFNDFTRGLIEVCEGQSLDKEYETKSVSLAEYIEMIRKKTAAMLQMCCTIGARLGKGNDEEIKALSAFGRNIGIAFQVQDDLLDITADEVEFGKKIGGDLIEGKKTFLLINALNKAKGKDKLKLEALVRNKGINSSRIPEFRNLYEKLGIIEDARKEIKKYTSLALRSVKVLKYSEDREMFSWLAESLIKRIK
ncbi:MAG TPA: polyprenyl synthetase family protein [Ignavibacteriaceae bacterium]|nr:polyprenyl synthetase family protein [Ignavibacteriaceae bacterium]